MAHPTKSKYVIEFWKRFIQQKVSHVFAVSQKTATELIKNKFVTEDRISIVNHSYTPTIPILKHTKDNTFIYVGRLVNSKGIPELLDIFSKHPNARLIVIGQGELEASVIDYSKRYQNIIYKGYIKGLEQIIPYYKQSSFILLNSQRTGTWEELFGIAIIEGMANGCVPITTNHPGPIEIISHNINGFIVDEKGIGTIIDYAIEMDDSTYQCLRKKAIETGQSYHCSNMASRWTKILNSPI